MPSSSVTGAVLEVNRAVTETAFVQKLEVHADAAVGEGTLAASHGDGHEEQLVFVDQPSLDGVSGKLGTAHGQVTGRRSLQLPDRVRIEVPLDPRLAAGHRLQRLRVDDLVGRLPDLRELLHEGRLAGQAPFVQEFAEIWQSADKVVYSKTLQTVTSGKTRIERDFDPDAVRQLKAAAARDLTVGGPELAAYAIEAGLVDEYQLFLVPVAVGRGKRALPDSSVRVNLELLDERRFRNGTVYLQYRARN